jgi:hypothetical protein
MATLSIGKDFSLDPLGRFRSDGDTSGEAFREDCLRPAINGLGPNEKLLIVLDDGVVGYGSSFLAEGFSGMVRYGYIRSDELLDKIEFSYSDPDFEFYKDRIIEYIKSADFNSQEYIPTKRVA